MVRDRGFYRRFFTLTLLIAMQNLVVYSVNLADNVMLGFYRESAMSGVTLVNQIQFLLQMLVMGIGEGILVLASRSWGEKDVGAIRRVASIGMRIALGVAVLMGVIVFCFPEDCLRLMSADETIVQEGAGYLRIICFSYVFFAMTNILIIVMRSVETVKIAFLVSVSTLCINVALNSLLIYGNWGFPELGARGAAIATLTSRVVEFLIMCVYLKRFDRKVRLRLRDFLRFDWTLFRRFLRVGMPVVASNGLWGAAMFLQMAVLGHMPAADVAIGANSIANTAYQISSVVLFGSASATSVIIGKAMGERRQDLVRQYAKTLQVLYLCIGAATSLLLFFSKDLLIQFYAVSDATRQTALQFMTVLSVTAFGSAYQMPCLTGIVRAGGDTKFVMFNDLIFCWAVTLPISAVAAYGLHLSPVAVFFCLKADQLIKCAVAVVKVNRFRWLRTFDPEEPAPTAVEPV